jgi:hypothetical protein
MLNKVMRIEMRPVYHEIHLIRPARTASVSRRDVPSPSHRTTFLPKVHEDSQTQQRHSSNAAMAYDYPKSSQGFLYSVAVAAPTLRVATVAERYRLPHHHT